MPDPESFVLVETKHSLRLGLHRVLSASSQFDFETHSWTYWTGFALDFFDLRPNDLKGTPS